MNPEEMMTPEDQQKDPAMNDDNMPMTGGHPMAGQMSPPQMNPDAVPPIDPMDMLNDVISKYMEFVTGIVGDKTLDPPIISKILVEQAQALSSLVPLLKDDSQVEMAKMQMEMEMKQQELEFKKQEHEMDMQMKQADMQFKQQDNQQKLQFNEQSNQQKIQQQETNHQQSLVQGQQAHESKMAQAKQAAQSKPSSNPSSGKGGK